MKGEDFVQKRPEFCYHPGLQTSGRGGSLSGAMDAKRTTSGKWDEMSTQK